MNRVNEGSSVFSFVVIGGILALLLVSGVYFVRQQITTQAGSKPQTVSEPEAVPPENKPNDLSAENKSKTSEENDKQVPPNSTISGQAPQSKRTALLPQTGPVENITALLAVALLSGTLIAYIRSRRDCASL